MTKPFELNKELEPIMRAEWELNTTMPMQEARGQAKVEIGQKSRPTCQGVNWRVNWFRYCQEMVIPKILPSLSS